MSVKININEHAIQVKIDNAWSNGLEMLSSEILRDCNKYCKEDTGMLIMSSYIHSNLKKGLLIWNTPYAARQYYEIQTAIKDVNSNASWRWCEVAKQRYQTQWGRQAQAIMRLYSK
jgi:hypothetical protein